jgi:hypothetical protein
VTATARGQAPVLPPVRGRMCGACGQEPSPTVTFITVRTVKEEVAVCSDPALCRRRGEASGVWGQV